MKTWLVLIFSFLSFCDNEFVFVLSSKNDECKRTEILDFKAEFEVMKGNSNTLLKRVINDEIETSVLKKQNNELENTMRLWSCKIEELNDIIKQNQLELNETRSELSETQKSFADSLSKIEKSFTDSLAKTQKSFTDSLALFNQSDWMSQNKKEFIGFSAYMSEDFVEDHSKSLTKGDTIIFDKTETNPDNDYKTATGAFTAPSSGMYAFTWTLCVDSRIVDVDIGEFGTELIVNGQICGKLHADTESRNDDACSTGFILKHVRKNETVYLRNIYENQGSFLSKESQTRTTFSGWKLN